MNKSRRELLESIAGQIEELLSQLEGIHEAEQEAFDGLPESFQNGEAGEKSQAALDMMDCAMDGLREAIDSTNEAAA